MPKTGIPTEWDLGADPRYKRQNMEWAMRGQVGRGLVELITNPDDRYRDLEDEGMRASGKIRIEIERKKKGSSIIKVRDRAGGMSREEMFFKLGTLGRRTSGFEKGKARRGLHGRGARDVVAFGVVHFESIKDERYNHLIIPPSLKCHFTEPRAKKADQKIREGLAIPKGNGTVVTLEVENRFKVPQHGTLVKDFSRYYALRDILSNSDRKVILVDLNTGREDPLIYKYPEGEIVFDDRIEIPNYSQAEAHLLVRQHPTPFEQDYSPYREGILVKSAATIHECTHFGLESDPFAWRFTGELYCQLIDKLIREYDDREEENPDHPNHPANNPVRLLGPFRDGLIPDHPFTQSLYRKCREILKCLIPEAPSKRRVISESLEKKLNNLSKEISKVFERRLKELEEEVPVGPTPSTTIEGLPLGLHIIPSGEQPIPIIVDQPKTFSIVVKSYEALDKSLPVYIRDISGTNTGVKISTSPVHLREALEEDEKVGRTTFTVESYKVGAEALIEARYNGYDELVLVRVVEPLPFPTLPDGLSFDKPLYRLRVGREKPLTLWLKASAQAAGNSVIAKVISDHPEIVVKGGGKCRLHRTDTSEVFIGRCRIIGRQLKAKGNVTAWIEGVRPAEARVMVEERGESKIELKFEPDERSFGSLRYKWDERNPYLLYIGAKHPSIRRYLGEPINEEYPGRDSPLYHTVLAEVIAEALAFRILEKQFKQEGEEGKLDYTSTDAYYHKFFSEFLSVAHKILS